MTSFSVLLLLATQIPSVPEYWGSLTPGPTLIGFTQRWVIDSTRRLPGGDSLGLRYRPILLNLWYPASTASTAPMRYNDYFDGAVRAAGNHGGLVRYATALSEYARGMARRGTLTAGRDSIPVMHERFESLLSSVTAVARDVAMQRSEGPRPVVVYISGAGSSYDDNVVLCEYLASRGFIVIGSAFPREDNSELSTSASDESRQRDTRRLLWEVARLEGVELGRVVAIGHSAGAQALLLFTTDPTAPIDAVLSLDTTQDYARLSDGTWAYFTDKVVEMRAEVRTPVMFVAAPGALFELGDSLSATRRWFVQVPDLSHNDFISQGVIRHALSVGLAIHDSTRAHGSRASYDALLRYIEAWLTWFSAGDDADARQGPPATAPLEVAYAAPGENSPTIDPSAIPSARALRHLFSTASESSFVDATLKARGAGAAAAEDDVLMMLLTGALSEGDPDKAHRVYALLAGRDSTVRNVVDRMTRRARLFDQIDAPDLAAIWWGYVSALDPAAEIPEKYRP